MKWFMYPAACVLLCVAFTRNPAVAAPQNSPAPKKVAILLFDGVEIIDYTGPYEVFGADDAFEVYTVSSNQSPITTSMGMRVVPEYGFGAAPQADVVIIPGGVVNKVKDDVATLQWIKKQSAQAEHVMSVCNGAITLANTGLLQGLTSTTTRGNIDYFKRVHPELKIVRDQRVVDSGKIVTTGGLSAGIDGALHVMAKMRGEGQAKAVAVQLEYDWHPEGGFLPGTDAIHVLPWVESKLKTVGYWDKVISTQGNTERWDIVRDVRSDLSAAQLVTEVGKIYAAAGKWSHIDTAAAHSVLESSVWKAVDGDGKSWTVTISVDDVAGQSKTHLVKIGVVRAA
jgi:putative intracellular protease/amidase